MPLWLFLNRFIVANHSWKGNHLRESDSIINVYNFRAIAYANINIYAIVANISI